MPGEEKSSSGIYFGDEIEGKASPTKGESALEEEGSNG